MSDNVIHPSHYNGAGIECIDVIRLALKNEGFAGYCAGNCLKYLYRREQKNGKEDIEKARVYYEWLKETDYIPNGMYLVNTISKMLEKAEEEYAE